MDMEKYPSLVEGTGLENREVGDGAGVRIRSGPPFYFCGFVAQSVEQRTENPRVGGSIPPGGTIHIF